MLKASKSRLFEDFFALYNRNLFNRRFHSINISGLEKLQYRKKEFPLIIYANHSSWWDGLIAFKISRAANLDSFIMMEEKQLKKLPFFRKLGAFSVIRDSPREAFTSINYAAKLLSEKSNRCLWIFPQGKILPNNKRPINFSPGVCAIIKKLKNCAVISFALKYEFLNNYKPDIFTMFGDLEEIHNTKTLSAREKALCLEKNLTDLLEKLNSDINNQNLKNYVRF